MSKFIKVRRERMLAADRATFYSPCAHTVTLWRAAQTCSSFRCVITLPRRPSHEQRRGVCQTICAAYFSGECLRGHTAFDTCGHGPPVPVEPSEECRTCVELCRLSVIISRAVRKPWLFICQITGSVRENCGEINSALRPDDLACRKMAGIDPAPSPFALTQTRPGLKKVPPYWHPYRTNAKERWLGREMLELISSEFRDRSVEYYVRFPQAFDNISNALQRYALDAGVTTINGKPAKPDTIVKNGDKIECGRCLESSRTNLPVTAQEYCPPTRATGHGHACAHFACGQGEGVYRRRQAGQHRAYDSSSPSYRASTSPRSLCMPPGGTGRTASCVSQSHLSEQEAINPLRLRRLKFCVTTMGSKNHTVCSLSPARMSSC